MKAVKIIVLTLSIVMFTVASFVFLIGQGAERTVLNEDFYQEVFEETDLAALISENITEQVSDSAASNLNRQEIENVEPPFEGTFDEAWVEESATTAAANLIAWLKGDRESSVILDISDKQDELQESMSQYLNSRSSEELSSLGFDRADIARIQADNYDASEDIPAGITIADLSEDTSAQEIEDRRRDFQEAYEDYRLWTPIVLGVLAVLILVTAGVFGGMKWIGSIMTFAGGSIALSAFAVRWLASFGAEATLEGSLGAESANDIISLLVERFTESAVPYALIGLSILIIGIIGGLVYRRSKRSNAKEEPAIKEEESTGSKAGPVQNLDEKPDEATKTETLDPKDKP